MISQKPLQGTMLTTSVKWSYSTLYLTSDWYTGTDLFVSGHTKNRRKASC